MAKEVQQRERVIIRFAGDSGDGMQLTGDRFTSETAEFGNDISTLPDFPAEIRAPAGTLPGVSAFQLHFADHDVMTPGDAPDVAASRMDTGQEVRLAARQGLAIPPLPPPPLGFPQDGNARFLVGLAGGTGGMTGHAGLFGRARDLWALAAEWLAPRRLLQPAGVAAALIGGSGGSGGSGGRSFALGWWRRTLRGSAGRALSPSSFGHTGFAGNSLWSDPETGRIYVLLSSRTDPAGDVNRWRRRFHALAIADFFA